MSDQTSGGGGGETPTPTGQGNGAVAGQTTSNHDAQGDFSGDRLAAILRTEQNDQSEDLRDRAIDSVERTPSGWRITSSPL